MLWCVQFAELEGDVAVAGRIMLRRVMGKLAFVTLRDDSGTIQLYVDKSILEAEAEGGFACASLHAHASCTTMPWVLGCMKIC